MDYGRLLGVLLIGALPAVPAASAGIGPEHHNEESLAPEGPASVAAPAAASSAADPAPGRVVVIDAGHGGRDLGAVISGRMEKEIVLAVSFKLQERLRQMPDIAPLLTRGADEFVALSQRVERAEGARGQAFVSLHLDNVKGRTGRGVIVYVYGPNRRIPKGPPRLYGEKRLPPPPASQVRASRRLADSIRRGLGANGIRAVRYVDRGGFAVLKSPSVPSVLVELGNMRDKEEAARFCDPRYQDLVAKALAEGLRDFLRSAPSRASASR